MEAEFDTFAKEYEQIHQKTISISGEESFYFTELKINLLADYFKKHNSTPKSILDYGCGTGRAYYPIQKKFPQIQYYGVDPSQQSINVAIEATKSVAKEFSYHVTNNTQNNNHSHSNLNKTTSPPVYTVLQSNQSLPLTDCCMCAVVAHHIPPANHNETFQKIFDSLTPGGYLFLFEHNPHNPLTRKVVRDCPFDKDAILLKPSYAKKMLASCGFQIEKLQYYFFFPKSLSLLRPTEKMLSKVPFGAQYFIVAKKPLTHTKQ